MVIQIESTQNYETKTQEIARQLLAETREKKGLWSALQDQMRWDDKLLDWAMSNPNLRVQLFRFLDCLPALRSTLRLVGGGETVKVVVVTSITGGEGKTATAYNLAIAAALAGRRTLLVEGDQVKKRTLANLSKLPF